jgi:murein DD-endopeptidase MepM/ murein hydrolase activator NlpD
MKKTANYVLLLLLCVFSSAANGQNLSKDAFEDEVEAAAIFANDAQHPCITPEQYQQLEEECTRNIRLLGLDKNQHKTLTTSLSWPLRPAANLHDCGYHFIGAYVDQNPTTGTFKDFHCGANTYDAHQGTDIAVFPYGFYKMDNSQVEVIAAADGVIVAKADGNFDRNCVSTTVSANYIMLQHTDGTYALYWHMKKNSVTTKAVGQSVITGEYLGVVGSSGSSSGPHLHFEVRTSNTNASFKDPFAGACNSLNASSWWATQKNYKNPEVLKVSVNTTDIVIPACPTTETPNESDTFHIPFQGAGLAPGYAKFYLFLRDDTTGNVATCKILNPNGSVFNTWTYTSTAYNKVYIKGYSKLLPTTAGTYTFQATYNGLTCSKTFEVVTATSGIPTLYEGKDFQVFPNPAKDKIHILAKDIQNGAYLLKLQDVTGQEVVRSSVQTQDNLMQTDFSIANLANGIYFLIIEGENSRNIQKIVKQ